IAKVFVSLLQTARDCKIKRKRKPIFQSTISLSLSICPVRNFGVRLSGGPSRCEGWVEVYYNKSWMRVVRKSWSDREATVVCRQLGCGSRTQSPNPSQYKRGNRTACLKGLQCSGSEEHLGNCSLPQEFKCGDNIDAAVLCADQFAIRLVNGTGVCDGRLEIFHKESWGTVCDDSWDLPDANVVCRQLQCETAVNAITPVSYGPGTGHIWLDDVHCQGNESFLWNCTHQEWGQHDCRHKEDVGVNCKWDYKLGQRMWCTFLFIPIFFIYIYIYYVFSYFLVHIHLWQNRIKCKHRPAYNQDVRLMDGGRACEGRVEVFYNEEWGTVCDDYWDLNDAVVVCRQLGCGDALLAPTFAHFGEGAGKIVLDDVSCTGEESALNMCASRQWGSSNCNHKEDASVVCSGRTLIPCSGRLEVFHQSVCEANFDQMAAEVVCRELKCGAPKQFGGGMFGRGSDSVLLRKVQCVGDETQIINCISPNSTADSCTRRNHVGIVCVPYRLVNGSNSCSGRVEFYYNGQWGTVCDHYWDLQDANVFCNQIGCGYAIKAPGQARFGEGHGEIWRDNLQCEGNEADLTKCPVLDYGREECTHRNDAGIICSGDHPQEDECRKNIDAAVACTDYFALRLVDGRGICDGRLEIFHNGSWGTVCDDSWDIPDANVVCRQLQCEAAPNILTSVSYGPGSGYIWLDEVHCQGNESSLQNCGHQTWGQHDCKHKEDVGVNCTEFKVLRLTNGCSGQLQVFYNNSWGSVCANGMDKTTTTMICQELGCGNLSSSITDESSRLDPDPKWLDNVKCRGHESSIWQCPSSPWECFLYATEPQKLRLVGGTSNCSGRVELLFGDIWGTVCDDDWDLKDAQVVCRQLGCREAVSADMEFGGGNGVIWLNKVKCRGTETHLWFCQHDPLGRNDCEHKEDAGVNCTGEKYSKQWVSVWYQFSYLGPQMRIVFGENKP
uniref:SRCR domain-containing protein n=1 Tax=Erpetoichthys calabaricus TaxID=27687 RepID=A0A8C4RDM1_ERPCA